MQYYIKVYNKTNNNLVGYYKETGKNCLSTMMNGIKFFNDADEALKVAEMLDEGFIRDKDKHYYSSHAIVYGDATRQPPKEIKKSRKEKEDELDDALDTFIRKNRGRY